MNTGLSYDIQFMTENRIEKQNKSEKKFGLEKTALDRMPVLL